MLSEQKQIVSNKLQQSNLYKSTFATNSQPVRPILLLFTGPHQEILIKNLEQAGDLYRQTSEKGFRGRPRLSDFSDALPAHRRSKGRPHFRKLSGLL